MIKIVDIKGTFVFPIYKNGHSATEKYVEQNECKWLFNEQCKRANPITVFLRRPVERFVSGVHTYIQFERRAGRNVDYEDTLSKISAGEITNEHFSSQYDWLCKLQEYYSGIVIVKTVNDLRNLIPNRESPKISSASLQERAMILKVKFDLRKDHILFNNYVGSHMPIKRLLGEIDNAVS